MIFANLWQLFEAFLLDYLIIAAYLILLVIVSVGLGFGPLRSVFQAMFADPNSSEFSAFLLLVLPIILYFALFEHSSWQATWGKRKMGLRVIDFKRVQGLIHNRTPGASQNCPCDLSFIVPAGIKAALSIVFLLRTCPRFFYL